MGAFIETYKLVKQQRDYERKMKAFVGRDPDYALIQQMINRASGGIVCDLTFPNGTTMKIHREDVYDVLKQRTAAYNGVRQV